MRGQEEDFGVDLEAELDIPTVGGALLKLQVKSRLKKLNNSQIQCRIKRAMLEYANSCRLPVILVVADCDCDKAWYVWLQEWLFEKRQNGIEIEAMPRTITVSIPAKHEFVPALHSRLRDIAQCKTAIQMVLSLRDAMQTSIAVQSNELAVAIAEVLDKADKTFPQFPIKLAIGEMLRLECQIWGTQEGNRVSILLFEICRRFGDRFDADLIAQMVVRGEGYSRTGINALGILYDEFPERMQQLKPSRVFAHFADPRVQYYCQLRERYFQKNSSSLVFNPSADFRIGKWDLAPGIRGELPDKWANRGDSAILDYVILRRSK